MYTWCKTRWSKLARNEEKIVKRSKIIHLLGSVCDKKQNVYSIYQDMTVLPTVKCVTNLHEMFDRYVLYRPIYVESKNGCCPPTTKSARIPSSPSPSELHHAAALQSFERSLGFLFDGACEKVKAEVEPSKQCRPLSDISSSTRYRASSESLLDINTSCVTDADAAIYSDEYADKSYDDLDEGHGDDNYFDGYSITGKTIISDKQEECETSYCYSCPSNEFNCASMDAQHDHSLNEESISSYPNDSSVHHEDSVVYFNIEERNNNTKNQAIEDHQVSVQRYSLRKRKK